MNGMENKEGFTPLPHNFYEGLLCSDLTKRELKVVLLVHRLTAGCHRQWARLIQADLIVVKIGHSHAQEVYDGLLNKKILIKNEKTDEVRINEDYFTAHISKSERLTTLIGKHIKRPVSQKGNTKVTGTVTEKLPNQEANSYQFSNIRQLPNREHSGSNNGSFTTPKDILKISLNNDKDSIADKSFKEEDAKVDPLSFVPNSNAEYCALRAWKKIEPDKPDSFNFYLWAVHRKLPVNLFGDYAADISASKPINPGAVFVSKVMKYFTNQKLKNYD